MWEARIKENKKKEIYRQTWGKTVAEILEKE